MKFGERKVYGRMEKLRDLKKRLRGEIRDHGEEEINEFEE